MGPKVGRYFNTDTAYELYMRLQDEIVNLFIKKWLIMEKKIIPLEQSGMATRSSYNRKIP